MSNAPSPSAEPVTAFLNALTAIVAGVASPLISEHLSQSYDDDFRETLSRLGEIMAMPNDAHRADLLNRFVVSLCADAGTPTGDVSDRTIRIPVSHFLALVTVAAGKVKADKNLAALSAALRRAKS